MRTPIIAALALVWAAAHGTPAPAQTPPTRSGRVVHVKVTGNLETMQSAVELKGVLLEARREQSPLVVIELGGDESRLDVVQEMGRAIHEAGVPVVAYLNDRDGVVGAGALALGLVAEQCYAGPDVTVKGRAAGLEQATLAPDGASFEGALTDLARWMGEQRGERSLAEGMHGALLSPSRPVWGVINNREVTVAWERPADGEVIPIVIESEGHHTVSLTARDAVRLGYCAGTVERWDLVLNRRDLKRVPRLERAIAAGLAPKTARAEALLTGIDALHDRAKAELKLPWPAAKDLAASRYHDAARNASGMLKEARSGLVALERLLEQYPEVMRRPAPGQTTVAGKPSSYASRWRTLVQQRKDRIVKLEETTKRFAGL